MYHSGLLIVGRLQYQVGGNIIGPTGLVTSKPQDSDHPLNTQLSAKQICVCSFSPRMLKIPSWSSSTRGGKPVNFNKESNRNSIAENLGNREKHKEIKLGL